LICSSSGLDFSKVSVTLRTTVRAGGNVEGEFHDIRCGGNRTNLKSGRTGSRAGIAGASRIVVGGVRPQRDERSKVSAVRGDQILDARLMAPKPASSSTAGEVVAKSRRGHRSWQEHWGWIEAVVEEGSPPRVLVIKSYLPAVFKQRSCIKLIACPPCS
jgi:hypothetical protein